MTPNKSALRKVLHVFNRFRFRFEAFDKRVPNSATLFLWLSDASERPEKLILAVDDMQISFEVIRELLDNNFGFVLSQQPVVDQNATEL